MLDPENLRRWCVRLDEAFLQVIHREGLDEQPDSRAFGAYVERTIKNEWNALCSAWNVEARPVPGRRTIYDAAFNSGANLVGVDFKSKDLADNRYSDGGVCSVGNLLRLYQSGATFLITEFGYRVLSGRAEFIYVRTAPFHALPESIYRIENLGTGQVRLNESLHRCWEKIEWDRALSEFLGLFCKLSAEHYQRVAGDAERRARALSMFVDSGFSRLPPL
ncbi:hypothetical protein AB0I37_12200 [Micromonospora purpureochromogenes]|uniref:hypothetical protein n=1 Tax=Micromonospora purpureochromogenes TaxID=47872 RepID=UPI0033C3D453